MLRPGNFSIMTGVAILLGYLGLAEASQVHLWRRGLNASLSVGISPITSDRADRINTYCSDHRVS